MTFGTALAFVRCHPHQDRRAAAKAIHTTKTESVEPMGLEKAADRKLTEIAEARLNLQAAS